MIPPTLLKEAESAAMEYHPSDRHFKQGVQWLFTRLCEMSEGEFDEKAANIVTSSDDQAQKPSLGRQLADALKEANEAHDVNLREELDQANASYQKRVDINQKLVNELAQAQARIKELEADVEVYGHYAEAFGDLSNCYDAHDVTCLIQRAFDEAKEREQKLVAALGMLKLELRVKADGTQLKCTCGRPNCYSGHFNHGDVVYRVHYNEIQRFEEIVEEFLKAHKGGA